MQKEPLYTIRTLALKSGVSMHTIRAWEKRYQALRPQRTPGNRRLYTEEDLARLQLLRQGVADGHTISLLAGLPTTDLWRLVHGRSSIPAEPETMEHSHAVEALLENSWRAVQNLDDRALQKNLHQAAALLSQPVLLEQLLAPLLQRIGHGWSEGRLRILHEHMATIVIRDFLTTLRLACTADPEAPVIIIATPAGQLHEMGALFVALTAAAQGWQIQYLGTSLPADELAAAAHRLDARIIALSIIQPSDDPQLPLQLEILRNLAGSETILIAGGGAAAFFAPLLDRLSIHFIAGITQLREFLARERGRGQRPQP